MSTLNQKVILIPRWSTPRLTTMSLCCLHLDGKVYYSLNATGARIWELLKQDLSLEEISLHLQDEFDVEVNQARESIAELVDELARRNLISVEA